MQTIGKGKEFINIEQGRDKLTFKCHICNTVQGMITAIEKDKKMEKHWPQLYAKTSKNEIKQWRCWVTDSVMHTEHGLYGGKLQHKIKSIIGKNIGKANETTPFEQAVKDAQSTFNKKKDKKYIEQLPTDDNAPNFLLPMLAHPFEKRKHNINWPALAQPKLNGVRCMSQKVSKNKINFTSRKGKSFNETLVHLEDSLLRIMQVGEIFDGEIYKHGWTFQQIVRRVKKVREDTCELEFWVYDVADEQISNISRNHRYMTAISAKDGPKQKVVAVNSEMIENEETFRLYAKNMIAQGFEGGIIRNANAMYKFDHRSADLQKLKEFIDKEFKIIDTEHETIEILEEDGSVSTQFAAVFVCENEDGQPFNVRPRGSNEYRTKLFSDSKNLIGKDLTVRFQNRSEDNIPIFPVGITIRDYE